MTKAERALVLFLRVVGTSALLALPFVFVPYSWMDAIHRWLGMGELPSEPIVGYLARSTSAFYALQGGLAWVLSYDVRRHRPTLVYLALTVVLFGAALVFIDWHVGMPRYWAVWEGPFAIVFGIVMLMLTRRVQSPRGS